MCTESFGRFGLREPDFVQFADDGSGSTGVFARHYADNQEEEQFPQFGLPNTYKPGTNIRIFFHWVPMGTDTGAARWCLEYTWANINGTFPDTVITTVEVTAHGVAKKHQIAAFDPIDGTDMQKGTVVVARVFRDATHDNDTFDGDAALVGVGIQHEIQVLGSQGPVEE